MAGEKKGDYALLKEDEEILRTVLRTRKGVKPVFVSPRHKIDLPNSIGTVLKCIVKYRLPLPVREANIFVNQIRNNLTLEMDKIES